MDNASKWLDMAVPEVYSAELSEFVFAAGVKLLQEWQPDVMYLTTTDFVQHKYAPGVKEANDFYEMFDKYLGQLDAMGAAIVVTADHGMKPKHHADGSPSVVYMQDVLDEMLGKAVAARYFANYGPICCSPRRTWFVRNRLFARRFRCCWHIGEVVKNRRY